jgi:hypothetical protein
MVSKDWWDGYKRPVSNEIGFKKANSNKDIKRTEKYHIPNTTAGGAGDGSLGCRV